MKPAGWPTPAIPAAFDGFDAVQRRWDSRLESTVARILPGEFYVTPHHEVLVTTLGSCVSACIRDPKTGVGGMNHFLLPRRNSTWAPEDSDASFGSYAMERLVNEFIKRGSYRESLEVKVVGGGQMMGARAGQSNVEFVFDYLRAEKLSVVSYDIGGPCPRQVRYFPRTGQLHVRKLPAVQLAKVAQTERETLVQQPATSAGSIELFTEES